MTKVIQADMFELVMSLAPARQRGMSRIGPALRHTGIERDQNWDIPQLIIPSSSITITLLKGMTNTSNY